MQYANLTSSEPNVSWVEHLFKNLYTTYEKLQELGFTNYNGKISIIEEVLEDRLVK